MSEEIRIAKLFATNPKLKDLISQFGSSYKESYKISVLEKCHVTDVVELISEAFCQRDPMSKYLGITVDEFRPFAQQLVSQAAEQGLSIVATDNGKLVGCVIQEDYANPILIKDVNSKIQIIFAFLEQVSNAYYENEVFEKNTLAHVWVTVVDTAYLSKGLAKRLNYEIIRYAHLKGFSLMSGEVTHPHNKGIFRYLNCRAMNTLAFKNFYYNGIRPFENLEGQATLYVWAINYLESRHHDCIDYLSSQDNQVPA